MELSEARDSAPGADMVGHLSRVVRAAKLGVLSGELSPVEGLHQVESAIQEFLQRNPGATLPESCALTQVPAALWSLPV